MPLTGCIVDLELLLPLSRSSPAVSGSDYLLLWSLQVEVTFRLRPVSQFGPE